MALKPGTAANPDDFVDSMAEEMEKAFREEFGKEKDFSNPDLKKLFASISKGVVRHLQQNHDAFKVEVDLQDNLTANGEVSQIE